MLGYRKGSRAERGWAWSPLLHTLKWPLLPSEGPQPVGRELNFGAEDRNLLLDPAKGFLRQSIEILRYKQPAESTPLNLARL